MSLLDRERTVAPRGYNRWLIPPAALAVHLSIGEIYAFSVFKVPLKDHFGTGLTPIGIIFSIAIGMLGLSAAFGGRWVERAGPRKAMTLAAVCWGTGFLVGALGVASKQLWIVYLGVGFIGGIGLGIGYISPVSTLIKWFPDKPGMATGLAIMGFGGGALIASPLEAKLLASFADKPEDAIVGSFVVLGLIYFVAMMLGAMAVKVPADGWRPGGRAGGPPRAEDGHGRQRHRHERDQDAAVLAAVDRPVLQRHGRHRHPRAGGADDPGLLRQRDRRGRRGLRRPALDLQHERALRVVVDVGRDRAQADLHDVPRGRRRLLLPDRGGGHGIGRRLRRAHRHHHQLLRRRLRDRPGVPQGPVRDDRGRRDPRPAAGPVVGGRRRRAAARRAAGRPRDERREVRLGPLRDLVLHHGRRPRGRVPRQSRDQAGQR